MPQLANTGRDLALQGLPNGTVDVIFDAGGNVSFDDSESFRVTALLVSHSGEWFADPTGKKGSRLHHINGDRRAATVSELESASAQALVPAIDLFITDVTTKATRIGGGKFLLIVSYRSRGGKIKSLSYEVQT